ncbi:hypothetical protein EDD16DRAFT_1526721 [Pisolithus croceorrhizus]|nr:hypothetical protein EDD16DRAFT_1526721 [Pisolithus croceorrhizus]
MYRTKVSSGLEAKNDSDEGGNRKTRKQQPTCGEESEAVDERKSQQRKKQKGTTGEGVPAATWGSTVASVQKASKSTVGARSQVATGSNAMEQIVAHTGSNPEAAMTTHPKLVLDVTPIPTFWSFPTLLCTCLLPLVPI